MGLYYELLSSAGGAFWSVFLISIAVLIASQAMTTATFSCIKQATALGCLPRLKIMHTSRKLMGQTYIPVINWFLLVFSVAFVATFGSINEMGNAYGTEFLPLLLLLSFLSHPLFIMNHLLIELEDYIFNFF